jgi:hypothetical protein
VNAEAEDLGTKLECIIPWIIELINELIGKLLFPAPKEGVTLLAAIEEILGHEVDVISLSGLLWSTFRSPTRSALAERRRC